MVLISHTDKRGLLATYFLKPMSWYFLPETTSSTGIAILETTALEGIRSRVGFVFRYTHLLVTSAKV